MSKFRFVKEHKGLDGDSWYTEKLEGQIFTHDTLSGQKFAGLWRYVPGSTATTEEQGRKLFKAAQEANYSKTVVEEINIDSRHGVSAWGLFSKENDQRFEHEPAPDEMRDAYINENTSFYP